MPPLIGVTAMNILETTAFKYHLGERLLFEVPPLRITSASRIGLIGLNGSGKTTLLELLAAAKPLPADAIITCRTTLTLLPQLKSSLAKSGGETTQAYILQALKQRSGLLLADEPTNNLDLEHLAWLEKELRRYNGALVLVSHDREFLDALCTEIWSLENGKLVIYQGNYSSYVHQKAIAEKTHDQAYARYTAQKTHLEKAFAAKQRQAQKATKMPDISPSEARITGAKPYFAKKQKKLQQTGQALLTRLEQLDKVDKRQILPPVKLELAASKLWQGQVLLRAQNLSCTVGKKLLWQPANFSVKNGTKLALIGPNGCGKTTLLKQILQASQAHSPALQLAGGAKIGYYSQAIDILDAAADILSNLRSSSSQSETLLRTVLIRLRFRREDFLKPVRILSGGEKAKVALAKLFVSDCNVLMLDEPTNHLDLDTVNALEELLCSYPGTLLFVSHDRRMLQTVAQELLIFKGKELSLFPGTYKEYLASQATATMTTAAEELLLIENKLVEAISRLSISPSPELEKQFQDLLVAKRQLLKE